LNIQIIQVPYDSGHKSVRMGRGPEHFLERGIDQVLRDCGHQVSSYRIESNAALPTEIGTMLELNRRLAERVNSAVRNKMFPIVLAGNCNSCLGAMGGIGQSRLGIIWFDAHGDFNTPETTLSGCLDGMGLAMAAGHCWRSFLRTIPGFDPIPEANILHIGVRDLDPEEKKLLQRSEIEVVTPYKDEGKFRKAIDKALDKLRNRVKELYLHVDIDVLDTGEALPNHLAVPGGLSEEVVEEAIRMVKERFEVCASALTAFDPDYDKNDKVLDAGIRIIKAFAA